MAMPTAWELRSFSNEQFKQNLTSRHRKLVVRIECFRFFEFLYFYQCPVFSFSNLRLKNRGGFGMKFLPYQTRGLGIGILGYIFITGITSGCCGFFKIWGYLSQRSRIFEIFGFLSRGFGNFLKSGNFNPRNFFEFISMGLGIFWEFFMLEIFK